MFLKEDHIRDHKLRNKLILSEIFHKNDYMSTRDVDNSNTSTRGVDGASSSSRNTSQELREPRRSGRVISHPTRNMGLIEAHVIISNDSIEDPLSFKQAMEDIDKDEWVKAMNLEMEYVFQFSLRSCKSS